MKLRYIILLLVIAFVGCKKDETNPPEDFQTKASGNWAITKVSYYYADDNEESLYSDEFTPNSSVTFSGDNSVAITDTNGVAKTYTYVAATRYDRDAEIYYYETTVRDLFTNYFAGKNGSDGPYKVKFADNNTMLWNVEVSNPQYNVPGSSAAKPSHAGYFYITFKRK
ncbi:hypothetical protein EOD41_11020 [Mucilaginibacter limnophilus]|uniref:Lipocalin-like domain-containing protein n=1 Tax=Mucilaginibacter limnophilus TaxID=1932778 RepID=A0A437MSC7_9SPHI|nr:hypothetical protein [Mucilaginibacter limnophilus]RVU00527.1 hypothetical protein EOD41_11020 [Mucilaginibacter limnophilus]